MLSRCVEQKPEIYVATPLCVFVIGGLALNIAVMADFMHRGGASDSVRPPAAKGTDRRCLIAWSIAVLGIISLMSFALTGLVSNDVDGNLHEAFARAGFFCYAAYTFLLTLALWAREPALHRRSYLDSVRCKGLMVLGGAAAIVLYVVILAVGFKDGGPETALCEWVAFTLIILFNLTYGLEFSAGMAGEELEDEDREEAETEGEYESAGSDPGGCCDC